MRSSLVILSLWIFISIDATTQEVCPEPPKEDNAQISQASIKSNYNIGDEIDYICNNGYVSLGKITYKCRKDRWSKQRHTAECTLKRCELPADIPNGHYTITTGNSFVVGATIKYTCNNGYKMMSRFDTRSCRPSGWDNHLPVCEEVFCAADVPSENRVKVEGLSDYGDLFRHGNRLQFSCAEPGYALKGPEEITCQSNGEWSEPFPHCEEITCKLNETEDFRVERIPDHVGPMKPGHQIKLSCVEQGMIIREKTAIVCQENGEWNITIPKCEEATCVQNIINMIIDGRPNSGVIVRKPGDRLKLSCDRERELVLQGQEDITCQENGDWSSLFPSCVATICGPPPTLSHLNADTTQILDPKITKYSLGIKVQYTCLETYKMEGDPFLICQQGTWKIQFRCIPPCLASVDEMDKRNIQLLIGGRTRMYCPHTDHITFMCQKGKKLKANSVPFRQQCVYGKMTLPECA